MKRKNRYLEDLGVKRGTNSKMIIREPIEPKTNTKMESQVWLLTTRYTPLMNATETIARDAAKVGRATRTETVTNLISPSCDQIRATTTVMEVYNAMVLLITKR